VLRLFLFDSDGDVDEPGYVPVLVRRNVEWGNSERQQSVDQSFVGEVLQSLRSTDDD
jgi:hypothetical protein